MVIFWWMLDQCLFLIFQETFFTCLSTEIHCYHLWGSFTCQNIQSMDALLYKCVVMYVFGTLRYICLFWCSIWIAVIFNAVKVQAMNKIFIFKIHLKIIFSRPFSHLWILKHLHDFFTCICKVKSDHSLWDKWLKISYLNENFQTSKRVV